MTLDGLQRQVYPLVLYKTDVQHSLKGTPDGQTVAVWSRIPPPNILYTDRKISEIAPLFSNCVPNSPEEGSMNRNGLLSQWSPHYHVLLSIHEMGFGSTKHVEVQLYIPRERCWTSLREFFRDNFSLCWEIGGCLIWCRLFGLITLGIQTFSCCSKWYNIELYHRAIWKSKILTKVGYRLNDLTFPSVKKLYNKNFAFSLS